MRIIGAGAWLCAAGAFLSLSTGSASAFDAGLDPSFGSGGVVRTQPAPGAANAATSLALEPDGRVVAGGYAAGHSGSTTSLVMRLRTDGAFDPSFGQQGSVVLSDVPAVAPAQVPQDFGARTDVRVSISGDGRILVLGSRLVRLTDNGGRDAGFGSGGAAVLPAGMTPRAIALAPDGRIVVVGTREVQGGTAGVVTRLTGSGQPDPSFGNGGVVDLPQATDPFTGGPVTSVSFRGVALHSDGGVVVAGTGASSGDSRGPFAVVDSLLPDGTVDDGFGQSGSAVASIADYEPSTVRLDSQGRVLVGAEVCGAGVSASCGPAIAVFSARGQLEQGSSEIFCGPCERTPGALSPLPDGRLLLSEVGSAELDSSPGGHSLVLTAFDSPSERTRDRTLLLTTAGLPPDSRPNGVTLPQNDGKLLVAGSAPTAGGQGAFVARLFGLAPRPTGPRPLGPAPTLRIPRHRLHRTRRGVKVLIGCAAQVTCHGRVALRTGVTLGRGHFAVPAGRTARILLKLTHAGKRRLRPHRAIHAILRVVSPQTGPATARVVVSG